MGCNGRETNKQTTNSLSLPDDGSYVIRNMLEYFNVCLLDFCVIQILKATIVIIECISWLIKVTYNNDARWKPEIDFRVFFSFHNSL